MPANDLNDASKIKIRRDTAQNWAELNPILDEGEIGIETDTNKLIISLLGRGILCIISALSDKIIRYFR